MIPLPVQQNRTGVTRIMGTFCFSRLREKQNVPNYDSSQKVTGPSLTRLTCILAPNWPVSTHNGRPHVLWECLQREGDRPVHPVLKDNRRHQEKRSS